MTIFLLGCTITPTSTAANFKSGSFERGSIRLLVTLLARAESLPVIFPQCIGRNTTPSRISSEIFARARVVPRVFFISTG